MFPVVKQHIKVVRDGGENKKIINTNDQSRLSTVTELFLPTLSWLKRQVQVEDNIPTKATKHNQDNHHKGKSGLQNKTVHRAAGVPLSHSVVPGSHCPGPDPSLSPRGVFPQLIEQFWFELRWNYPMELKYTGKEEKITKVEIKRNVSSLASTRATLNLSLRVF